MAWRTGPQPVVIEGPRQAVGGAEILDLMRAASPPRQGEEDGGLDLYGEDAVAVQYKAWKKLHPSALEFFDSITSSARDKRVAVFLDYDGTLSPIVEDPERAFMSDQMRAVVKEVATLFPTAIISGRGREKVFSFVKLSELYYAGSHGLDIAGPSRAPAGNGSSEAIPVDGAEKDDLSVFQPAAEYVPLLDEIYARLQREVAPVPGAFVEHNKFSVTVHFRRVAEQYWEQLGEIVRTVVSEYPKLRTTHGRKVLEVRPKVEWNKGTALAYLLKALDLDDSSGVLPLYIGDDRTDEDAFNLFQERGCGCGILVSTVAKPTAAAYSLRDPSEVSDFLHRLVKWRQEDQKVDQASQ